MSLSRSLLPVLLLLAASPLSAQFDRNPGNQNQQNAPNEVGFPVTGRVVCQDTQRPARFAQVTLIPAAATGGGGGRRINARTDLDGHFTLNSVPAGDYFVAADLPGYVNDAPIIQNAQNANTPEALKTLAAIPRVLVTPGGASTQLALERGAVLAGQVTWDDGTPAAGVFVTAQPASAQTPNGAEFLDRRTTFGIGRGGQTDDQGHFRIPSLAPGSYLLRANVQSPLPAAGERFQRVEPINVYAPGKFRRTDAATFTVNTGEERTDGSVVLALNGLHVVSGQVSASSGSVRSGSVTLSDQQDSSLTRRGSISADGRFTIPYVPAGNYTLRVQASRDIPGAPRDSNTTGYQPTQVSITVTDSDLTGLSLTVTPAGSNP